METLTVGGLFEGIGGFPLAAQWAGFTPIWSNEIDPFCCQVLRKNFKHRIIEDDIRNIGKHNLEPVDILTGGFPCQPVSTAGQRKGEEDYRWLWPENFRIIKELRPKFYVGENVRGLLNFKRGLLFNQIQTDLENEGYEVISCLLPACGVEAPHRRERIWFTAHSRHHGNQEKMVVGKNARSKREDKGAQEQHFGEGKDGQRIRSHINGGDSETVTDPDKFRCQGGNKREQEAQESRYDTPRSSAAELRGCWDRDDLPTPTLARVDDGIPNLVDRIKSLGNAIVPQVALEIFKAIQEVENLWKR